MILDFSQGIVTYPIVRNKQSFLFKTGSYVSLQTKNGRTDIVFAHGSVNYLFTESLDVDKAWGPLKANTDHWIYWDIDLLTAKRTFGYTTIEPKLTGSAPSNPVNGQHWFDSTTKKMYVFEKPTTWREVVRVFAAKVNNANITSLTSNPDIFSGSQVDLTIKGTVAGRITVDSSGYPIRKRNGQFFTTEDEFFINGSTASTLKLEANILNAVAEVNIGRYQIVKFVEFGKINLASYHDIADKAIAISMEDISTNSVGIISLQGLITNPDWNFSTVGASLWVGEDGLLTSTDPFVSNPILYSTKKPPIGKVISKTSIIFDQGMGGIGVQGPRGAQGLSGNSVGPKGDIGPQGEIGPQGDMGPPGEQGEIGPIGPQGPRGEIGPPGPRGEPGPNGEKGEIGSQGETGPQGEKGDKGDTGEQGIPGAIGPQGEIGPQGLKGDKGDKGDTGEQGIPGELAKASEQFFGAVKLSTPADNIDEPTVIGSNDVRVLNALQTTGGTMTGSLILNHDPVDDLEAATKKYVDDHSGLLTNLSDVLITNPIGSNDYLAYDTLTSKWINKPEHKLANLPDVDVSGNLQDADLLVYNDSTSKWINKPLDIASDSTLGVVKIGNGLTIDETGVVSVVKPGRHLVSFLTDEINTNGYQEFEMVLGGTITILELSVSTGNVQVEAFSSVDRSETNPYAFISSLTQLVDDGSSIMSDGSVVYGRRYTILSNLDATPNNTIYWKITNLDGTPQTVTLNVLYVPIEICDIDSLP